MLRKKYLYGIDGEISQIFSNDSAEIQFDLDENGSLDYALLKKGRFYHNGRLIPENVQLSKYVRINMKVKFSCHVLDHSEQENQDYHQRSYSWYAIMCWINNQNSPHNMVSVTMGLYSVSCGVESVRNRHGVVTMMDNAGNEHRIEFLASKFYFQAKRFPSSKMLTSILNKDDRMFCDAVPCMEDESRDNCRWFATCAFQGKRPRLAQPLDMFNDFRTNYLVQTSHKFFNINSGAARDESNDDRLNQYVQQSQLRTDLKSQLLKVINLHTSNPRTLFTSGYGFVLDVLNDEFAILLGCFKLNLYQTILFHRRNAFLFKSSLARSKLSEIFVEGDRMRFIAVGAPPNFVTDWIAVQVSVAEFVPEIEDNA